jgi:hypothetical protein
MSRESVCWINHFHFVVARTLCERHLERHIIPSKRERREEITIKLRNIIFNLDCDDKNSILMNILIKNTILEWFIIIIIFIHLFFFSSTIKIKLNSFPGYCYCLYYIYYCCCLVFYFGICTPNQVNDMVDNYLGENEGYNIIVNRVYVHILI